MYKRLKFIFRFSLYDLKRKGARTLLVGIPLGMLAGIGAMILGINMGIYEQMIQDVHKKFVGNYVVHEINSQENDILWPDEVKSFSDNGFSQELENLDLTVKPQYRSKAFSYSGNNQMPILLMGVDVNYGKEIDIVEGATIFSEDSPAAYNSILITQDVADKLGVMIGEDIAVEVVTADGFRNFDYFNVTGIYKILGVPSLMTNHIAYINMGDMQQLKNDFGFVTEIMATIKSDAQTKINRKELTSKVGALRDDLIVKDGAKFGGIVLSVAYVNIASLWVIWGVIFMVMSIFLYDFIVGSVRDQLRELVVMFSVGASRLDLMMIVHAQITVLSLVFILSGITLGLLFTLALSFSGIEIPVEALKPILGGHDRLYPAVSIGLTAIYTLLLYSAVLMAGIPPLLRVLKLDPVSILRNEE